MEDLERQDHLGHKDHEVKEAQQGNKVGRVHLDQRYVSLCSLHCISTAACCLMPSFTRFERKDLYLYKAVIFSFLVIW